MHGERRETMLLYTKWRGGQLYNCTCAFRPRSDPYHDPPIGVYPPQDATRRHTHRYLIHAAPQRANWGSEGRSHSHCRLGFQQHYWAIMLRVAFIRIGRQVSGV
jgi:hypothetical protein